MLVAVTAGKAAPGATTCTIALALCWPRDVVLVDADPAGGDIVPGLLPGRVVADRGLLTWSTATRRLPAHEAAAALAEHVVALPEAPHVWVLPGVQTPAQGSAVGQSWPRVAAALERLPTSDPGRDVVVDLGRLGAGTAWPVLSAADVIVLVTGSSLRSITAAAAATTILRDRLGDLDAVRVLVVDRGAYPAEQVAARLGCPLVGRVPGDERTAAALTDGAPTRIGGLTRTRLLRAIAPLPARLSTRRPAREETTHA